MAQSPLLGYNTNVKHGGRVFHIQTEDSGVTKPHVLTHVFADGGRILRSARTTYTEHLGRTDLALVVKKLMQDQHKAMFIAVRDGHFDAMFEEPSGVALALAPAAELASIVRDPEVQDAEATMEDPAAVLRMAAKAEVVVGRGGPTEAGWLDDAGLRERTLDEVILAFLALELERED